MMRESVRGGSWPFDLAGAGGMWGYGGMYVEETGEQVNRDEAAERG